MCVIQALGIAIGVVVAAMEIESIIVSGPVLSLLGLAIALNWRRSRSLATLAYGLSPSLLSLLVFALINIMEWGPREATTPVMMLLLAYEILFVPLGLAALYGTLADLEQEPLAKTNNEMKART